MSSSGNLMIFKFTYYPIVIVVGFVLNVMTVAVLCKNKRIKLSHVYRYLLSNLAVADAISLGLACPLFVLIGPITDWEIGTFACKVLTPFGDIFIPVSSFSVVMMVLARYRVIKQPFQATLSKRAVLLWISAVWIFAILAEVVPLAIFTKEVPSRNGTGYMCYVVMSPLMRLLWLFGVTTLFFIIPVVVFWILFALIHRRMKASMRNLVQENNPAMKKRQEENFQATRLIFISGVVYTLLLSPNLIFSIVNNVFLKGQAHELIFEAFQALFFLNNAINPILYVLVNKAFRDSFKSLLTCCFRPCGYFSTWCKNGGSYEVN